MKYCKKCGKEFDDSMRFCTHCGGSLEQKTTGQESIGGRLKPKPRISKIIVFLVAILAVCYFVYDRIEKKKQADQEQIEANKLMAFAKYKIGVFGDYGAEGLALVCDNDHSLYGFINERYEVCIPCIYQRIEPFEGDVTIVELAGNYTLMNKHGEIVGPLKYSEIGEFSDEGYARAMSNDKWWLINRKGEEIRPLPNIGFYEGHETVDLDLPNGTLWATCNIGASEPEDYGNYYAWGETKPQYSNAYDLNSYKYAANGYSYSMTKYCNNSSYGNNGFTDNLTALQMCDDPAASNWGSGWRTPTKAQWDELLSNTTHQWSTQNGVKGHKFTSKKNGATLFFPAAGIRWDSVLSYASLGGYYWSRSLYTDDPNFAWGLDFHSDYCDMTNFNGRSNGLSVRAVREN